MGGLFAKLNCMSQAEVEEMISRKIQIATASKQELRPSEDIIKELTTVGIIPVTGSVAATSGGLKFDIAPDGVLQRKKPRRLSTLMNNKVAPQGS